MIIIFNGKKIEIKNEITIEEFLMKNHFNIENLIVEYNGKILKEKELNILIENNSVIELMVFTGGG
ncbi:MAG: MoaD/ThiS family protein [Candidatus Muiribacteriota bacterium]|jgi:thiamine biosynthesis protein ThiS